MQDQATVEDALSSGTDAPCAERPAYILDVRTPAEFREVHIPGSCNVPLADLGRFMSEIQAGARGKEVVLVCKTGSRAQTARDQLQKSGLSQLVVMEGGILRWIQNGRPVNRGVKGMTIERQVRIVAGAIVLLGVLLAAVLSPWFLVIPAFIGAGQVFAGLTDWCGMGILLGRLPFNRARS